MGLFSSGKKYKRAAEAALANARLVQDYQSEQEFRRQLISNIRQERIARAQLEVGNYSTTASTSSQQGAIANIDSSLAGETYFSYASSDRAQQIQNYNDQAEWYNKRYQKAQKKRAAVGSIVGTVVGVAAGALTGGFGLGLGAFAGGIMGGQVGQGVGQLATGQTQNGINNLLGGAGFGYNAYANEQLLKDYNNTTDTDQVLLAALNSKKFGRGRGNYILSSVDPASNQIIPGSSIYVNSYIRSLRKKQGY